MENTEKYNFSIMLLYNFLYNKYRIDPDIGRENYHSSVIFEKYIKIHYPRKHYSYYDDAECFLHSINSGIVPYEIIQEVIEFQIANL